MLNLKCYSQSVSHFPVRILCPCCGSSVQIVARYVRDDLSSENWGQCTNAKCRWSGRVVTGESLCN